MTVNPATYQTPFAADLMGRAFDPVGYDLIAVWGAVGAGKSYGIAQLVYAAAIARPGCSILVSAKNGNTLSAVLKRRCDRVFGRR